MSTPKTNAVLIRRSKCLDAAAMQTLARANGQTLRDGSYLLAEVDGELVAAARLDGPGDLLGETSPATADIRELLRRLAENIRHHEAGRELPRAA